MKFLREANFLAVGVSVFCAASLQLNSAHAMGMREMGSNSQSELMTWCLVIIAASQLFYGLFFGLRLIYLGLSEVEVEEETHGNYWNDQNEKSFAARSVEEEAPLFVSPFPRLSYTRDEDHLSNS